MPPPHIIAFDLYDTLMRITRPQRPFQAIYEACSENVGLSQKEFLYLILTKEISTLTKTLPPSFSHAYHQFLPLIQQEIDSVSLFEETQEVLRQLSTTYPLVLISNLASPYKVPFFESGLAPFFQATFFSCELGMKKPEDEIFKAVEMWSGKSGKQLLMVGDNPISDGKGATNRGWNYLRINRATNAPKQGEISSLRELGEWV